LYKVVQVDFAAKEMVDDCEICDAAVYWGRRQLHLTLLISDYNSARMTHASGVPRFSPCWSNIIPDQILEHLSCTEVLLVHGILSFVHLYPQVAAFC
jgi:hypothetical protein